MDVRKHLAITTALAAALMASGCGRSEPERITADRDTAVCVDRQGRRVSDDRCGRHSYAGGGGSNAFLWYYLGRSSSVPYYGDRVGGGSFTRTSGATYFHAPAAASVTRSAAISRGGFGASARSHSFSAHS